MRAISFIFQVFILIPGRLLRALGRSPLAFKPASAESYWNVRNKENDADKRLTRGNPKTVGKLFVFAVSRRRFRLAFVLLGLLVVSPFVDLRKIHVPGKERMELEPFQYTIH